MEYQPKLNETYINLFSYTYIIGPYHKHVLEVTSKSRDFSSLGLLKMEDLPEQENKRSTSKINKKQNS